MVSTPSPPDPNKQAAAQASANRDASISGALINNYNEKSPFGNVTYNTIGESTYKDDKGRTISVPKQERVVTLSPDQQALFDLQNQAGKNLGNLAVSQSGRLNDVLNKPFNPQGLPDRAEAPTMQTLSNKDYSADRMRVEDAFMKRADRFYERDKENTDASLAAKGIGLGSQAYSAAQGDLNERRNDMIAQAILAGGQEQDRLVGMETNRAGFNNTAGQQNFQNQNAARSAALQEEFEFRNQPIKEISSLLSGTQITAPQFANPYQQGVAAAQPAQYMQDAYNAKLAQSRGAMNGIFGLGSSLVGGLFGMR